MELPRWALHWDTSLSVSANILSIQQDWPCLQIAHAQSSHAKSDLAGMLVVLERGFQPTIPLTRSDFFQKKLPKKSKAERPPRARGYWGQYLVGRGVARVDAP